MLLHPALLMNHVVNFFAEFRIRKYISFTASDSPDLWDIVSFLSKFSCGPRFQFIHNLADVLIGPNQYVYMIASNVGCRQLPLPDTAVLNDCFQYNNPLSLIQIDRWRFQFRLFVLIETCIGGDQFRYAIIPDYTVSRVSMQPASVCCESDKIRHRLTIHIQFPNNLHIQFPNNSAAAQAARTTPRHQPRHQHV